ncbi:MAG: hypothetical protein JXR78_15285 [Victivallales bacterium]|nr:hypothetical protein [Victivallales bacterium]
MGSIRLRADQIARLKRSRAPSVYVIEAAIRRFERGEIKVIEKGENQQKRQNVLRVFPVAKKFKYSGAELRSILDAHFSAPMFVNELAAAEKRVNTLLESYCGGVAQ